MRNWNIIFHHICEMLTVNKENTYCYSAHSVEHIMLIITKPLLVHVSIHAIFPLTCFGVRPPSSRSDTLIVYSLKRKEAIAYVTI